MRQRLRSVAADILDLREIGLNVVAAFGGQIDLADAGDDQQAQSHGDHQFYQRPTS